MIKFIDLLENIEEPNKDKIIADLQAELKKSEDRLEFEVNKYEKQIQGLKKGIFYNIEKHTEIALDDISVIAKRISGKEGDELRGWINNLKGYFESLGEKK